MMPPLPDPLDIRDWRGVSQKYYRRLLDPTATGAGFPTVSIDRQKQTLLIKSYLGSHFDREAFTCLSAVIGSKLVGLDISHLNGFDFVSAAKAWYDPKFGVYRHRPGDHSEVISDDIYGYWAAILGMILADQNKEDKQLALQAGTAVAAFKEIATGLGCPDHPDFSGLGWNFAKHAPGGRPEPMNKLGNAPSVAWMLMLGETITHDPTYIQLAVSALNWYVAHPGRYEISHVMGPLTAARLNAVNNAKIPLDAILAAWFGDGDLAHHPWFVTAGTRFGGMTCDGLDAARWPDGGFDAFSMGTLQGPAWLVPVVRYDPRYAKAIGRYALHAANSARLLEGYDLGPDRQDHGAWKAKDDPDSLFFYESLQPWDPSPQRFLRPYATGDVVINGWMKDHKKVPRDQYLAQRQEWFGAIPYNIAPYMGNHVGFLGGIVSSTDRPGVLMWDCLATDWFHPPAYPTRLIFNPYSQDQAVKLAVGDTPVDLYDSVEQKIVMKHATGTVSVQLRPDSAAVIVNVPSQAKWSQIDGRLFANEVVVAWQLPPSPLNQ